MSYMRDGRTPVPHSENTSRIMSSNKAKDTTPEVIVRKYLWKSGLKGYRLHSKSVAGRPDVVYIGKKISIFVHGCFWHRCPHCNLELPKSHKEFWRNKFEKNIERDKRKIRELKKEGWKVFVIWECQTKKNPPIPKEIMSELTRIYMVDPNQ